MTVTFIEKLYFKPYYENRKVSISRVFDLYAHNPQSYPRFRTFSRAKGTVGRGSSSICIASGRWIGDSRCEKYML